MLASHSEFLLQGRGYYRVTSSAQEINSSLNPKWKLTDTYKGIAIWPVPIQSGNICVCKISISMFSHYPLYVTECPFIGFVHLLSKIMDSLLSHRKS